MSKKPTVVNDWLEPGEPAPEAEPQSTVAIPVGSSQWFAWLSAQSTFKYESELGHFTAKREMRTGAAYWYAYRRRNGKLTKAYLGKPEELTQERLQQVNGRLAGQDTQEKAGRFEAADLITALNHLPSTSLHALDERQHQPFLSLTKIKPPALPHNLIARPRLTSRIQTAVTLIAAPSGSGKSTLLCEWRQLCGFPVAWVSLGSDDNTAMRFWSTVLLALQTIHPGLGQGLLARMRTPSSADLTEFVIGLTNEVIYATEQPDGPTRLGLILDDFHHIRNVDILASIQYLLNHLPPGFQLLISGHIKPSFSLGHLRGKGALTEIDNDELRFTSAEGIEFLKHHSPEHLLTPSDMQLLLQRTEGWAAGLKLATLMLSRPSDRHRLLETFAGTHTYLREYFTESVLHHQPPEVQHFLIKTSILKHLTGPLCDAVTGQLGSAELLKRLWQNNLFLVRSEDNQWYRYHDLFAEALVGLLKAQYPNDVTQLHRRAAEWYRTNYAPDDAVHHLLAIEAWEEAATLIEGLALRELEQVGEDTRLLRWLQQLPEAVVQQHKTLLLVFIKLADVALSRAEVRRFLLQVEANITAKTSEQQSEEERDVLAEIQHLRQSWASELGQSMPLIGGKHADVWQMLTRLGQNQALMRRVDMATANALMLELYEAALERHHIFIVLMAGGNLAGQAYSEGSLRRSEKISHQVLQQALMMCGRLPEPGSIPLSFLSQVCYERNELSQAEQLLLRVVETDPNPASANMPILTAILQAKIQQAQGDGEGALSTLEDLRRRRSTLLSGVWQDRDLDAYQALFLLRQGHYVEAARLLPEIGDEYTLALADLVRAELLLRQDQPALAEPILQSLLDRYPLGLAHQPLMGARIMLAIALFEQHKHKPSQQVMAQAIRLATPEGFLRPFLDLWPRCAPLLSLAAATEDFTPSTHAFVADILKRMTQAGTPQQAPLSKEAVSALSTATSISARELEVLHLLTVGLSNRQIAAKLCVAESTVKAHLDNIYRKLGVNNRTQAIVQAQALKLL